MKRIDYSYQIKAAEIVLKNALNSNYLASVLAACPNSGKTTISQIVISKYLSMYKHAKIVVLTEGQNTLKNQYLDELKDAHVNIDFTYGPFGSGAQVQVGIPQSINNLKWNNIDLLIVDEAHNFYHADSVQDIIRKLQPKHQVLMTGSPTKYNLYNEISDNKYGIHYIAAEELAEMGIFSAVALDVAKVTYKKNATQTIEEVIKKAKKNGDNLSKIMIACPGIDYAKKVAKYLTSIGRKVSLSTSLNDKGDNEIRFFKDGYTNALIVVGKGILGFNDKKITFLADLKSSNNLDISFQLFARVLRTHPDEIKKSYYRIADKNYDKEVLFLHKIVALTKRNIFERFTGKNLTMEVGYVFNE